MRPRKPARRKSAPPFPGAQEDLNVTSRALYGVAQAHEPETAAQDNESIEDPLQGWPDAEGAADQWHTYTAKETTMRFDQALCGAAIALALIAGCNREEPKPITAPAPPSTPQPAERPPPEAPLVGTPPGGTDAGRTVGQVVDDATINAKIKAALLQAPDVKGTDVNVDTVNGAVTLKGAVESQAQVDRAVQIARAAEGVKAVSNQLTLKTKP